MNMVESENNGLPPVVKRKYYARIDSMDRAYWYRFFLEEESKKIEIRYKLLIRFIRQQSETSGLILIDRISDTKINDTEPSKSIDELAHEAGKVFYPLVVEIDTRNNWLNICNHDQIKEKWKTVSADIRLRFSGKVVDRYIRQMNEVISDKLKIKSILENDLPMVFYFKTVYLNYTDLLETESTIDFPVGDYAPVPFQVKHHLRKNVEGKGYDEVLQSGYDLTEYDHLFKELKVEKSQNTYSAKFMVNNRTGSIEEAEAKWVFTFPIQRQVKVILYPLRQQPPKNEINYVIDDNCKPDKKGIFSILFGK